MNTNLMAIVRLQMALENTSHDINLVDLDCQIDKGAFDAGSAVCVECELLSGMGNEYADLLVQYDEPQDSGEFVRCFCSVEVWHLGGGIYSVVQKQLGKAAPANAETLAAAVSAAIDGQIQALIA